MKHAASEPAAHPDDLLLTSDVARQGDVTPATVRRWDQTGRLPSIRTFRGMRLFRRADVEHFLGERRTGVEQPVRTANFERNRALGLALTELIGQSPYGDVTDRLLEAKRDLIRCAKQDGVL